MQIVSAKLFSDAFKSLNMKHYFRKNYIDLTLVLLVNFIFMSATGQQPQPVSYKLYIEKGIPEKKEIDVFLNELSWSKFDPVVGYKLSNFMPHDGYEKSATISTVMPNGARTSMNYVNKPCRINTYGNSFTQCHQVSDGETWQEYLAARLGFPMQMDFTKYTILMVSLNFT